MVTQILEGVLIPLLCILTKYIIDYFSVKRNEAKIKADNELANKYIDMIYNTITHCVIATNQTYVDSLKSQGNFDKEAQQKAFEETLQSVKKMLGSEALQYLDSITDDTNFYLTKLIEAKVKENKKAGT